MKYKVLFDKRGSNMAYDDVCVILPTYNQAQFLRECLLSVVRQTLPNIRLVIVDDCSIDGTTEILSSFFKEYQDRFSQLLILSTKSNIGPVGARNIAINAAPSQYYFMLDSDNFILPSCLEKLLSALEHSDAAFAYPIIQKFGDNDGLLSYLPWNISRLREGNYIDNMSMIRGDWLQKVGCYLENPCAAGWEDYDLWIRIALEGGEAVQVPEILAKYRVHDASRTNRMAVHNSPKMRTFIKEAYPDFWNINNTSLKSLFISMQSRRLRWLYGFLGLLFVMLCYVEILDDWWAWDDFHLLVEIQKHAWYEYFFDRSFYEQSKILFTPMEYIFYELNYFLFGLRPHGFYFFNLLSILGVYFFTARLLQSRCGILWSWIGAIFICLLAPIIAIVHQIQCVHYLAGLLFLAISIGLYISSVEQRNIGKSILGAVFFMVACLCKEIYVTAPIVLLFLFKYDRSILKYWIVFPLISVIYLFWRFWILESVLVGFGIDYSLTGLIALSFKLISGMVGDTILTTLFLIATLVGALTLVERTHRFAVLLLVAFIALLIPLHTVAYRLDVTDRALTLFAWSVGVCIIYVLSQWSTRNTTTLILSVLSFVILCIGSILVSKNHKDDLMISKGHYEAVGKFMLFDGKEEDFLLLTGPVFRAREASELRSILFREEAPGLLYDPIQLDLLEVSARQIWVLDQTSSIVKELNVEPLQLLDDWNSRTRDEPLSLHLSKQSNGIRWDFGPYNDANYSVILISSIFGFNNVYHEGIYSAAIGPMSFVLRYKSPEGWITYSDTLQWYNMDGEILNWSRPR